MVDNKYRIESLAKGLSVLRLFDETTVTLKLREICDLTGIPMPTAFRIVATLEEEGFLDRTPDGSLRPGVSVLTLGSSALRGSSLVQVSEKPLRDLATATGETVNMGVLLGDQVLYLARLRNADLVTANVQVGSTLPAVYTSMGKLLLAFLDPDELTERLGTAAFESHGGPNAVQNRAELDARLADIRAQGYSIQDQELALGLRSVSVPVFGADGTPAAAINIAVSASRHDVDSLRGPLLTALQATAHDISIRLGGTVSRIDPFVPGALSPEQAALYESIAGGPRAQGPQHFSLTRDDGSLAGPFNALLLSPGLGTAIQELGAAVRYRTALSARERELAILIVATHWQSAFEIMAHEAVGRAVGLTEEELSAVRDGRMPELEGREAVVAQLTSALVHGDVDDELWLRASGIIDQPTIFELTTLVGYYALLALQLRVFRVEP